MCVSISAQKLLKLISIQTVESWYSYKMMAAILNKRALDILQAIRALNKPKK